MSKKKNETPQEDRRIQRTHQLLKEALLALIVEKGYETINVQDITDRANVGRATFYLHYPDKEHLALACVQESMDKLTAEISLLPKGKGVVETAAILVQKTFQHMGKHQVFYLSFLNRNSSYPVVLQIQNGATEVIRKHLTQNLTDEQLPFPVSLLAEHLAASLMAMVKWWLNNDQPYSAEQMTFFHLQLVGQGLQGILPQVQASTFFQKN